MNKSGIALGFGLTLALLVAVAGFGVSIYLSLGERSAGALEEKPGSESVILTTADFPSDGGTTDGGTTGGYVGDRVPDFTLELADGRELTSRELIDANRPTFLFFFATT